MAASCAGPAMGVADADGFACSWFSDAKRPVMAARKQYRYGDSNPGFRRERAAS